MTSFAGLELMCRLREAILILRRVSQSRLICANLVPKSRSVRGTPLSKNSQLRHSILHSQHTYTTLRGHVRHQQLALPFAQMSSSSMYAA